MGLGTGRGLLDGKVAFITGAASGIGRAAALRVAGLAHPQPRLRGVAAPVRLHLARLPRRTTQRKPFQGGPAIAGAASPAAAAGCHGAASWT